VILLSNTPVCVCQKMFDFFDGVVAEESFQPCHVTGLLEMLGGRSTLEGEKMGVLYQARFLRGFHYYPAWFGGMVIISDLREMISLLLLTPPLF